MSDSQTLVRDRSRSGRRPDAHPAKKGPSPALMRDDTDYSMEYLDTNPDPANWLDNILQEALRLNGSDILLNTTPDGRTLTCDLRVDGRMRPLRRVEGQAAIAIMGRFKAAANLSTSGSFRPEETVHMVPVDGEERKARVASFRKSDNGTAVVMRLPPKGDLKSLDELRFSDHNLGLVYDLLGTANRMVMLAGPMGSGKGSPASERILTPTGWTTYGEVSVGDQVIGSDGRATTVTGVHPRGVLPVYRVTMNDGASVVVDGDHLWAVKSPDARHEGRAGKVLETRELASKPLRSEKSNGAHRWFIPLVGPVEFTPAQDRLAIHPYVLGALLGDGSFDVRSASLTTNDDQFAREVESRLPQGASLRVYDSPSRQDKAKHHAVVGNGKVNPVSRALADMGLMLKKSADKFVPQQYLLASIDNRTELLKGLLDSDGSPAGAGAVEFTTVSDQLAESVTWLVRSLGGVVKASTKIPTYTYQREKRQGQLCHRLYIRLPFNPFRISSKADRHTGYTKYQPSRAITDIEPAGQDEVICISVSAEDQLYVADHFIVTHNTTTAHGALKHVANGERTVWTIEDPVERNIPGLVQLEVDEENGAGFDALLPALVRSDYDTLFLGEIRDYATASAGVRQAKAGRQVLTTIHANDNVTALLRLIELAKDSPLSVLDSCRGVISQRLVGELNPHWDGIDPKKKYQGRVPIHEVLTVDEELIEAMMQGRPLGEIRALSFDKSFSTFKADAERLIQEGITDQAEINRVLGKDA